MREDVAKHKKEKSKLNKFIQDNQEKIKSLEVKGFKVDFVLKKPFTLSDLTRHINGLDL